MAKVAVVTGGSRGIGAAISKALKEAGATSLVYGHYIVEALREKLERDEQRS